MFLPVKLCLICLAAVSFAQAQAPVQDDARERAELFAWLDSMGYRDALAKPFVTVAALALADRGILDLDAPVTRWLPDFSPQFGGQPAAITVRHLLTHTSGLGYGFFQKPGGAYLAAGVSDGIDRPGFGLEENLHRLATLPLLKEPRRTKSPPQAPWVAKRPPPASAP